MTENKRMNMTVKYLYWVLLLLAPMMLPAQIDTSRSEMGHYFFEGDEVVFEFDRREYAKAMRASDNASVDFKEIDIAGVAVSGNFNNWSWDGWKMQKVDKYRYRLRKKVTDLTGEPNWQFKFVINGAYWTPVAKVKQGALTQYDLKNPEKRLRPDEKGNVLFHLNGFTDRRRVILSGNFNNWDEQELQMHKTATGWELRLDLKPGAYEYKFIADGVWMHDPANSDTRPNEHGTLNSVLYVMKSVRFELKGYDDAKQVILSGSFNKWDTKKLPMRREDGAWFADVPLTGGKHLYKFIVDGNWILDPANKRTETTWDGYTNSVVIVK